MPLIRSIPGLLMNAKGEGDQSPRLLGRGLLRQAALYLSSIAMCCVEKWRLSESARRWKRKGTNIVRSNRMVEVRQRVLAKRRQ
jgi:hypothetical protein